MDIVDYPKDFKPLKTDYSTEILNVQVFYALSN